MDTLASGLSCFPVAVTRHDKQKQMVKATYRGESSFVVPAFRGLESLPPSWWGAWRQVDRHSTVAEAESLHLDPQV